MSLNSPRFRPSSFVFFLQPLKTLGGHHCYKCKKTIKGSISRFHEHCRLLHGPETCKKLFSCSICTNRSYTTAKALTAHLKKQHSKQYFGEPKQHEAKGGDQHKLSNDKPSVKHQQKQSVKDVKEVRLRH